MPVLVEPLTLPLSELSHAVPTQSGVSAIGVPGDIADPLQSFLVQMDMSPSVGSLYEGEIKDYATVGGYILFQKPDRIRIVGTDPVMHMTVFDMVSSGDNKLERLRPTAFLTSLMIQPPDPAADIILLEEDTTGGEATYILLWIRRDPNDELVRSIYFDRHNLQIVRQKTFDTSGSVVSDTMYPDWMNSGDVTPDKFILKQPSGSELRQLFR